MSENLVALNTEAHRALRIMPPAPQRTHFVEIVASEFASAAATCPIFLAKNAQDGSFFAGAMFGFKPCENLLEPAPDGTPPPFRPLEQQREGFFAAGEQIGVDLASPRFSESDGEPLFDSDGQPAEALRRIQRILSALIHGKQETDAFIAALLALRLVEPLDVSLRFDDGEKLVLQGLYTVSLDALQDLDDAEVLPLFRQGHLQLAYAMAGSLKHIGALAHRRNARLSQAA